MKTIRLALLFLALAVAPAWAADDVSFSQLMQNPLFANATPEIRLQMVNQKMAADELDVSGDVSTRLFWDAIIDEPDPVARLTLLRELAQTYDEFWGPSDIVNYVLVEYLATTEEAANKDFLGMMKLVRDLEEAGTVSTSSLGWLMDGFLALHLVTNAEYNGMSLEDKLLYLKSITDAGYCSSNTSSDFAVGLMAELMSKTAPEERQALLDSWEPNLVGFVSSYIISGYLDLSGNVALQLPDVAAAATSEEKLALINAKIEAEELSSSDLGGNPALRLLWDVISPLEGAGLRLAKYTELQEAFGELPITTEIEYTLALDVLAGEQAAQAKDVLGIMTRIQEMQDADQISWHAVAPLHYGMMAALLATNQEYQAMADMDKLAYLVSFDPQGWASSLTSSEYSEQLACEMISATPAAEQPAMIEQVLAVADFFTSTVVEGGYVE